MEDIGMNADWIELSSDDRERLKRVATTWNAIETSSDTGRAPPEVLEQLRQEVSDCLYHRPPIIPRAEKLTAQALLLISGCGTL
jgi:hypothetical protein